MGIHEENRIIKSGSNQVKIVEFKVANYYHGINLVKIKKIIKYEPERITYTHEGNPALLGIVEVDGYLVTLVDLAIVYGQESSFETNQRVVIIAEFNNMKYGFIVDDILAVHRMSWSALQPLDTCPSEYIIATVNADNKDIGLVDFETIVSKLTPGAIKLPPKDKDDINKDLIGLRKKSKIICADDSKVIRTKIKHILSTHAFQDITVCSNGEEAYQTFMEHNKNPVPGMQFTFMVTDVEMPRMDGLSLCKKVKDEFPHIPVLIFSSLVSEQFILKCQEVGANASLSKNNMEEVIEKIDELLLQQNG